MEDAIGGTAGGAADIDSDTLIDLLRFLRLDETEPGEEDKVFAQENLKEYLTRAPRGDPKFFLLTQLVEADTLADYKQEFGGDDVKVLERCVEATMTSAKIGWRKLKNTAKRVTGLRWSADHLRAMDGQSGQVAGSFNGAMSDVKIQHEYAAKEVVRSFMKEDSKRLCLLVGQVQAGKTLAMATIANLMLGRCELPDAPVTEKVKHVVFTTALSSNSWKVTTRSRVAWGNPEQSTLVVEHLAGMHNYPWVKLAKQNREATF